MSVFIIEHVYKSFTVEKKTTEVLKDINLVFPDKGLISIIGKSGSGKSTLLNILMGIEKPTKGKVYFNKKNIAKFNDRQFSNYHLNHASLIFQHYNLFEGFSALENAIIPLLMKGISKKKAIAKANEYFVRFGLENIKNNLVSKLSGGEKQRVAIIRSLLIDPEVILCDEPTGALDERNSIEIMEILKSVSKSHLVIFVSHNRDLVDKYSDKIIEIKNGKIENPYLFISKEFSSSNFNKKSKYKSSWSSKFFFNNLKKNFWKNLFSIFVSSISFFIILISIGFINGSSSSQNEALDKNLSIYYATVSETQFIELEGSPLTYEKTLRPSLSKIDEVFDDFTTLEFKENYSYFISNFLTCEYDKKPIQKFQMVPYFYDQLNEENSSLLESGNGVFNDFSDVIINDTMARSLGNENLINKTLIVNNSSPISYSTGDENIPFIKDNLNYSMKLRIVGIVKEFSFLNTPKIYYCYQHATNYLKGQILDNLSVYLGKKISYYDYIENSYNDDPVSSYSYNIFLKNKNEVEKFYKKIDQLKNENNDLQITSEAYEIKNTYSTFINSFSTTLYLFISIAFLGVNFILGMISFSTFIENKKTTAIMTCLGAKNKTIYNLYLNQNFLVIFVSLFVSIMLVKLFEGKINKFLYGKFSLNNLISVPFESFFSIPYGLIIILLLIFVVVSSIFVFLPMSIYRNRSLSDELRDE